MVDLMKTYVENKIQLVKLEFISVSANLSAKLISFFLVALFVMVIVILFNFAIALGIGQHYDNIALGFAIVGGVYLLIFIIYYLFARDKIDLKIRHSGKLLLQKYSL